MNLISRYWTFTKERFPLLSHASMILCFVMAHLVLHKSSLLWHEYSALFIGVFAFFYKLRIYDEIKDFEVDKKVNPDRPLARGLVSFSDLYKGIIVCILVELLSFSVFGLKGATAISLTIMYSLLMYKEFFIGKTLRKYLTTYAVTHTVICAFIGLTISHSINLVNTKAIYFALINWGLFNVFEFGRKTFISEEERENVESYSSIFTKAGAFLLVLGQGILITLLSVKLRIGNMTSITLVLNALIILSGMLLLTDKKPWGAWYRAISSVYIVLFFIIFILFAGFL